MQNAFTVDVEDYYHVEAFKNVIKKSDWTSYESRVRRNTEVILRIMEESGTKGTFFILGDVATRYPELVKMITAQGHEIASHGMSHTLVYKQSKNIFREETRNSKALLEDLSQKEVIGYRAATYSITNNSLWALDILIEEGFKYDSSIFPMRHDRYGIPDAIQYPHIYKTNIGNAIAEFPISVWKQGKLKIPVAGGGYFRLFPYAVTRFGLGRINAQNKPFVFYTHPWEVDPAQPRITNISALTKFRHYVNIGKCRKRLLKLTKDFAFTTMQDVLKAEGLL